jgi:DNA-binding response OmpR family regulator
LTTDILLIESSEETVGALRMALSPFDVALRVVPDGTRGIIEAEKQKPTAILLGLELPPKNYGYVVCQRLKKSNVTNNVPLILLYASATETDIDRHRTLRHRADAYVKKPFDDAEVVNALDELLGSLPRREAPGRESAGTGGGTRRPGNGTTVSSPGVEVTLHDDDILFDEDPPFAPATFEAPPPSASAEVPGDAAIELTDALLADLDAVFPAETQPLSANPQPSRESDAVKATVRGVARVPDTAVETASTASTDDGAGREGGGLRAEIERLTRVAETLRDELDAAKVQAGNELDEAKRRNAEMEAAARGAELKASDALLELDEVRARAVAATTRVDELKARVLELERDVASRDASIATLHAEAENAGPAAEQLRSALGAREADLGDVQARLDRALQVRERMRRAVEILKQLTDD